MAPIQQTNAGEQNSLQLSKVSIASTEEFLKKFGDLRSLLLILIVAALYFGAAKLGLSLAFIHANVSPVWPPTGVAIASLLLLGYRVWPGVFLGALFANLFTHISVATAGGIAIGNTLEALSAGYLVRYLDFHNTFEQAKDVFKFVVAAILCTMLSATIGNFSLCLGRAASWENFGNLWLTWWLGDTIGALLITPLLLTWGSGSRHWLPRKRYLEALLLLVLLAGAAMATFRGPSPVPLELYPIVLLTVPFFLWAAFRLGQRGVTVAILAISVFAVWGTAQGSGPFVGRTPNESLLLLQLFLGSNAVTFLFLVAAVEERRHSEETVRESERRLAANLAERKRAEEERERLLLREQAALAEAELANRTKDEFLAIVSHELRTPLTAIIGWAGMLQAGKLDNNDANEAIAVIKRNAKTQARLIDDLLDVARVVSGKLRLDLDPVHLPQVIQAAVDSLRPMVDAKKISLQVLCDTAAKQVSGDASRLEQIVWNLLSNAVKFTPVAGDIAIRLIDAESHVEILVSDTGRGITAEFLPHVFDRFRQADSSKTREGGLGLGLAIVRHLVELHGGTIEAASAGEGKGSTFIVRIPCIGPELQQGLGSAPSWTDSREAFRE